MYKKYVDEIINMIFRNQNFDERVVFGERGNEIGKELYKIGGYKSLYIVMELLQQELIENEYSSEYLGDLRELEFSFNGICHEWQA